MQIPDRIYLLIKDEDGEEPDQVMWCVDRIYDTDVEYVQAAETRKPAKGKYIKLDGTPVDCPTFVLLAKDEFALRALEHYANILAEEHPDSGFSAEVDNIRDTFYQWRQDNPDGVKIPD